MENRNAELEGLLEGITKKYQLSFTDKIYDNENDDGDLLMEVFGITPELKEKTDSIGDESWVCAGS